MTELKFALFGIFIGFCLIGAAYRYIRPFKDEKIRIERI